MKRLISYMLVLSMLITSLILPAAAQSGGYHTSQLVFRTENASNYRIPTVISTASGAVFAFCNDRQNSVSDYAETQWLAYSVARDGIHFSEREYLLDREGWSFVIGSAVYDAVENKILLIYYASIVTDAAQAAYELLSAEDRADQPVGAAIAESRDDGASWTHRAITLPKADSGEVASVHGAGAGIQLQYGSNAGRLVFAAKAGDSSLASVKDMEARMRGLLIYSDDHGQTWKASLNSMPIGTDETAVCELPDGTLYISSRRISNINGRAVAISKNGGRTITDKRVDTTLEVLCEYGIKGSLLCIPNFDGAGNALTLFSSLNSPGPNRRNLCIWLSYDGGKTWPEMVTVDSGLCSYSEMTYNAATDLISIVYERGDVTCYSSGIEITTFDVDWLMANKRENVCLRGELQLPASISSEIVRDGLLLELSKDFDQYTSRLNPYALVGYDTLQFDGVGELTRTELGALQGNMTYFIVFRNASAVPDNDAVLLASSHAQGIRTHMSETTASVTTYVGSSVYNCAQAQEYLDTDWHILAVAWDGDGQSAATLTQFQDGMTTLKYELGESVCRTSSSSGSLSVGSGFSGEIAEVLVWNRALDDTEIAKTGLALAEKFGLQWSMGNETPETPIENADVWDGTVGTAFDGGSGTKDDPYLIGSAETLAYLASVVNSSKGAGETSFLGQYFELTCNIDLADLPWTPIGNRYEGGISNSTFFGGTFDGGGYAVYHLNAVTDLGSDGNPVAATQATAGVFGALIGATVCNFGVASGTVRCLSGYAGGIVGAMNNGSVLENCYNRAKIVKTDDSTTFTMIGGIVGRIAGGKLIDTVNYGAVDASVSTQWCSGNNGYGGIAGVVNGSTELTSCYNAGDLTTGNGRSGGIAGLAYTDTVVVRSCHSSGKVLGSTGERGLLFGRINGAGSYEALTYYLPASDSALSAVGVDEKGIATGKTSEVYGEMLAGASVRCSEPTGLRFETAISKAKYDALVTRYGAENVFVGTLIAPSEYVTDAGAFTKAVLDAYRTDVGLTSASYIDVRANGWRYESANEYVFAGSIVDIMPSHYRLSFAAIGYIAVREGEQITYYYSAYNAKDNFRTIEQVVNAIVADPDHGLSAENYATVQNIKATIDAFLNPS